MSEDLGYDLNEALERRSHKISIKAIESLRNAVANSKSVPQTITSKQVK